MYYKFKTIDDAIGNLDAGIGASTTTITLQTGQGSKFPTIGVGEYGLLTIVQFSTPNDPTSGIVKKERILVTLRSSDTLTVIRGQFGTTASTFNAGDFIYLNVVAEIIQDIQDELDTKLAKDELRTSLSNLWSFFYTDGSGNEQSLSIGDVGKVLTSNGSNAVPSFEYPSVNINALTEDNTALASLDEIIFYDASSSQNKKRYAKSSNTVEGLVRMATNSEATTGTNETSYINPKQAKDNYGTTQITTLTKNFGDLVATSVISHSLGRIPNKITAHAFYSGADVGTSKLDSLIGKYTANTQLCKGIEYGTPNTYYNIFNGYIYYTKTDSISSSIRAGSITAVTNNSFTITWSATSNTYFPITFIFEIE